MQTFSPSMHQQVQARSLHLDAASLHDELSSSGWVKVCKALG